MSNDVIARDGITLPRKVGVESWADQRMAVHPLRINKGAEGEENKSEDRMESNPMLLYTFLNQHCSIELSAMVKMVSIYAVQHSRHQSHRAA